MSEKTKNYLKGYIGQRHIVDYGNLVLDAVASERSVPMQPLEFTGYAGLGKTSFAQLFAARLADVSGGEFQFSEMSSGITLPGFMKHWADHVQGRRAVVFMDEAHGLKNEKVKNILKRVLETEKQPKQIVHEEYSIYANPFEQLFMFATNEEPRDSALFGPTSRTKQLQFLPFTRSEALEVMQLKADKWKISLSEPAAEYLVDRVLPNGRAISELIENDALLLGKSITLETAKELVVATGRFPKGLRRADIVTLMFIGTDEKGKQVQEIAAAAGGEDKRTTSYRLQWLAGMGLMRTAGNGRKVLTQAGMEYLTELEKKSKAAKAAKAKAKPLAVAK